MQPIMANKKRKIPTPDWCNIHYDVFDLVLSKLAFLDNLRVQGVCSSWCSFAKTHISNLPQLPLIMLPTDKIYGYTNFDSSYYAFDKTHCGSKNSADRCLFKIEDKKFRKFKSIPKEMGIFFCHGSSQGWLVFFEQKGWRYHVFNPFFDICIKISSLPKILDLGKTILWSDPILSANKFALVALHGFESDIVYAMCWDSSWRFIKGENSPYSDIICFKDFVYTLGQNCSIEAWDFSTYEPTKKISIKTPLFQETIDEIKGVPTKFYSLKRYLVRSHDQFLMIVRYIEAFVQKSENGVKEFLPASTYGTKKFYVYQLNEKEKRWVKIDNLGDRLLVLGGNHSVSVAAKTLKEYEKNSIYFSDDNHKSIPGSYYIGHDMGRFNLGDGSIKLFIGDKSCQVKYPFWVVPQFLAE